VGYGRHCGCIGSNWSCRDLATNEPSVAELRQGSSNATVHVMALGPGPFLPTPSIALTAYPEDAVTESTSITSSDYYRISPTTVKVSVVKSGSMTRTALITGGKACPHFCHASG
jgi:hypothetical protein